MYMLISLGQVDTLTDHHILATPYISCVRKFLYISDSFLVCWPLVAPDLHVSSRPNGLILDNGS